MNPSVKIIPFPEIENAYIIISAKRTEDVPIDFGVEPIVSFFYDAGGIGAEWCPPDGPIQLWNRCEKGDDGATTHYFFEYHNSPAGNWSQLGVMFHNLPQSFLDGNYKYIFAVLKRWATRD